MQQPTKNLLKVNGAHPSLSNLLIMCDVWPSCCWIIIQWWSWVTLKVEKKETILREDSPDVPSFAS